MTIIGIAFSFADVWRGGVRRAAHVCPGHRFAESGVSGGFSLTLGVGIAPVSRALFKTVSTQRTMRKKKCWKSSRG